MPSTLTTKSSCKLCKNAYKSVLALLLPKVLEAGEAKRQLNKEEVNKKTEQPSAPTKADVRQL